MGRRKKCRIVRGLPQQTFFKPQGVPMHQLKGVTLPVEGLEAFELVDAQGLSQEEAAARMQVSRPTLCRILAEARQLVATALSQGMAIRIEGGDFDLADDVAILPKPGPGSGRGFCRRNTPACMRLHEFLDEKGESLRPEKKEQ